MILVLPRDRPSAWIDELVREAEGLGWSCEVSLGDEQVIVALSGEGDAARLEAAFASRADVDVVPLLSPREYARLRARRRVMAGMASGLGLLTAIGAGVPVAGFLLPPKGMLSDPDFVRIASTGELRGRRAKSVLLLGKPVILVRLEGERYVALSAICTHMSICHLEWDEERGQLVCPCHGGAFDLHGNVVQGPPSIPLATYPVEVLRDELYLRREG